jgi:hypothetical protein
MGVGNGLFRAPIAVYTGTNPVSLSFVNLLGGSNPYKDIVVTNRGSNDISVILTETDANGAVYFELGPRLRAGTAPVSTTVTDVDGDDLPDLLVVNQGSNTVSILKGRGGGFFDDQNPLVFSTGSDPIRVFAGAFDDAPGLDLIVVNSGQAGLTFYSNFMNPSAQGISIASGGDRPVAAIAGDYNKDGYTDLIVAHSGDSTISALYGGPGGLHVKETISLGASQRPTDIAVAPAPGNTWQLLVSTANSSLPIPIPLGLLLGIGKAPSFSADLPGVSTAIGVPGRADGPVPPFLGGSLSRSLPLLFPDQTFIASGISISSTLGRSDPSSTPIVGAAVVASITVASNTNAIPGQPMMIVAAGSFSSLVPSFFQFGQTQVTELLPIENQPVASVAIVLSISTDLSEELSGIPVTGPDTMQNPDAIAEESLLSGRGESRFHPSDRNHFISNLEARMMLACLKVENTLDGVPSSSDSSPILVTPFLGDPQLGPTRFSEGVPDSVATTGSFGREQQDEVPVPIERSGDQVKTAVKAPGTANEVDPCVSSSAPKELSMLPTGPVQFACAAGTGMALAALVGRRPGFRHRFAAGKRSKRHERTK